MDEVPLKGGRRKAEGGEGEGEREKKVVCDKLKVDGLI